MPEQKPAPAPAPKPLPKPVSPPPDYNARGTAAVAQAGKTHRLLRPFIYLDRFIGGTLSHGLDDMALGGRMGSKMGIIAGLAMAVLASSAAPLVVLTLGGFAMGAAMGALRGVVTGGMAEVKRYHRAVAYHEDLVDRAKTREAHPPAKSDYRTQYREERGNQLRNSIYTQQFLAREDERRQDNATYWQDHAIRNPRGGRDFWG